MVRGIRSVASRTGMTQPGPIVSVPGRVMYKRRAAVTASDAGHRGSIDSLPEESV
jgi:hypothetical protein